MNHFAFQKAKQLKTDEVKIQDYVSEFYENKRFAKPYSSVYHEWQVKKMLLPFLNLKGPILDNGCGTGFMAQFLKGYDVTGLDISPRMVEHAKKRYGKVAVGDAQKLPFPDSSFQIVINRGLLHHLPDPSQAISEIYRVLEKEGQAIFMETHYSLFNAIPRIFLKKGKHFAKSHKNFKEGELIKIIGSKLKIEKTSYFGYLAYPILGFTDVFDIYRFFPFKKILTPLLIKLDEMLAKIPILNRQAWGIIILARKTK